MEAALDGIIPARAGFTQCARNDFRCETDHPRSRGVYLLSLFLCSPHSGSSPLARGLPHGPYSFSQWAGIIPARAGFTTPGPGVRGCTGDHPRSRGVYVIKAFADAGWLGSSPLARGLRPTAALVAPAGGIIPARAGFTVEHERDHRRGGDHPRSRGVYAPACSAAALAAGSSPLARGLRAHELAAWQRVRIIPARAGFTTTGAASVGITKDHPRSRGVYTSRRTVLFQGEGSSPLARGLRRTPSRRNWGCRIIPARAGFTQGSL